MDIQDLASMIRHYLLLKQETATAAEGLTTMITDFLREQPSPAASLEWLCGQPLARLGLVIPTEVLPAHAPPTLKTVEDTLPF